MKTVAIIGIGLIGGSLGQALRKTKRYRVVGIARRRQTIREARRMGAVDEASTELSAVASADIVVIASPVDQIIPLFKRIVPFLKSGAVVTDVGSVKAPIVQAATRVKRPRDIYFVGAHPLAGSHKTGVKASHFRLFKGSSVVLTPGHPAALGALKSLWSAVGARVMVMSPQEHDAAVALISHLPHAIAHALVHSFAVTKNRWRLLPLLAGSFRDVTRVASADADQWTQIFRANAPAVRTAIHVFQKELARIDKSLVKPQLRSHLKKSQTFRRPLFNGR
jgi:prephenate dehydrogenase